MEALLVSTGVVALAEMGDKTQLLSLLLAAKFRRPMPIVFGIFAATLANHALAGAVGAWTTRAIGEEPMRWLLGVAFLAMAAWALIPDSSPSTKVERGGLGVFGTTVIAFFLLEMGDKTQVATVALAAQYTAFYEVVAGTTIGMMLANVPAVLLGERLTKRVPVRAVQALSAAIFGVLGLIVLIGI